MQTALRIGVLWLALAGVAGAAGVNLAWNPPTIGPAPDGYNIYWGTASGVYGPTPMPVGAVTTATVPNLADGTYFFALKSTLGVAESAAFSNEVSTTLGTPPPPPPVTNATLWPATTTPAILADSDTAAVNLGVQFSSDVAGTITGLRFYKSTTNTGTHVGVLWSSTGTLLASVTFTGETASGWQQANFATPISIMANTTYVASYRAPVGRYSANSNYFATTYDNSPLHASQGVYIYGAQAFPTQSYNNTNYWVDVVFNSASVKPTLEAPVLLPLSVAP